MNDLDSKLNYSQPTKYGRRYDRRNSDYLSKLFHSVEDTYANDALKNKKYFIGIVLRVETLTSQDSDGGSYEPGSMPQKKYYGKTLTADMVGIKVRVPELHAGLPCPSAIGESECQNENSLKCHHPMIDMYPTFYARSNTVATPEVGDLVRVTYRNIENLKDPIYLGIENKLLTYAPDPSYSGASNFGGGGTPQPGGKTPAATCGTYEPVPLVMHNAGKKKQILGNPCKSGETPNGQVKTTRINWFGKTVQVNELTVSAFKMVLEDIKKCKQGREYDFFKKYPADHKPEKFAGKIQLPGGGGYNCRCIKTPKCRPPCNGTPQTGCKTGVSNHSWGTAIDINPLQNPYSSTFQTDIPDCVVASFKRYGFRWGGDYRGRPDTMHFEFLGDPAVADASYAGNKTNYSGDPYCKGRPGSGSSPAGTGPSVGTAIGQSGKAGAAGKSRCPGLNKFLGKNFQITTNFVKGRPKGGFLRPRQLRKKNNSIDNCIASIQSSQTKKPGFPLKTTLLNAFLKQFGKNFIPDSKPGAKDGSGDHHLEFTLGGLQYYGVLTTHNNHSKIGKGHSAGEMFIKSSQYNMLRRAASSGPASNIPSG
ncbi:M15 family metallopeptidase [Luminiphilus sp.]|nr:M15 family metallopeptidase [Luminiphilus sp.]